MAAAQWWLVSYYLVYGRTVTPVQFMTVQADSGAAAVAAVKARLGSHASDVGAILKGPYATQAEASSAQQSEAAAAAGGSINPSGGPAGQPTNFSIPGLSQIGNFFGTLTQGNTWLRAGKILFGALMVLIGMAHITGAGNKVATAARKVPVPV